MKMMPNKCPNCGSSEMYDDRFAGAYCDDCGQDVEKVDTPKATKKIFRLSALISDKEQEVVTIIDGEEETRNIAHKGDYIVTGTKKEQYVLTPSQIKKRYKVFYEHPVHSAIVAIETLPVEIECSESENNFTFTASWGETMIAKVGDFLVYEDEKLSYRIDREVFFNTYELEE